MTIATNWDLSFNVHFAGASMFLLVLVSRFFCVHIGCWSSSSVLSKYPFLNHDYLQVSLPVGLRFM